MLVGEQSRAPRVVAGLRKLHPQLTPAPPPPPPDPDLRISGSARSFVRTNTHIFHFFHRTTSIPIPTPIPQCRSRPRPRRRPYVRPDAGPGRGVGFDTDLDSGHPLDSDSEIFHCNPFVCGSSKKKILPINGVLRQYYSDGVGAEWWWVQAAVRGGCLLAWREGAAPPTAARLPLRRLHLRQAPCLPHAFQLQHAADDTPVATFQACNANEYLRWVRALCIEILGQTPLPQVRFLDVLPAADTRGVAVSPVPAPVAPRAPPRVRRRLHTTPAPTTQTPLRREHSPSATDEGIVVEDDDYDSSSDRSVDLSLSLETLRTCTASPRSLAPVPQLLPPLPPAACDNCTKLAASALQHHTLPRATRTAAEPERLRHRYLKRWEGTGAGGAERGRAALEAARRRTAALESRARSCSPNAHEAAVVAQYVPVRERRALFESLSRHGEALARSSEQLARPPTAVPTPRRAASLHDLQAPPSRSVSDLRQFFEAVARGGCAARAAAGLPRHAPLPHRPFTSLTCA